MASTQQQVQDFVNRTRVIIYCRVSSEKQETDGESLEYQEQKCTEYAESKGYQVMLVLKETQSGYIHYRHRPKLTLARQMIKDGQADIIIVWDLRRFSRNFVHSALIFEEIEQAGGAIESVSENIDNSLTGKLIRSVLSWCAESERHKIVEYANRNWQTKLENNLPVGSGRKPYGWDWKDKDKTEYIINIEESAVRITIYTMFVVESMSLRAIAAKLDESGIPTPFKPKKESTIPGWRTTTIKDILQDERNIGILSICKYKRVLKENGKHEVIPNPNIKKVPGGIPAIIDLATYEQAQVKLVNNKHDKSNEPDDEEEFLVRGHIFCKVCGWRMRCVTRKYIRKGGNIYKMYEYACTGRNHKLCSSPAVIVSHVPNNLVWEDCCKLFQRTKAIKLALERAIDCEVGNTGTDKLDENIAKLQAEIEKAYKERKDLPEGSYLYNLISADLHEKNKVLQAFEEERRQAQPTEVRSNIYKEKVLALIEFLDDMAGRYHEATFKQKLNAIDALGVKVLASKEADENGQRIEIRFSPHFAGLVNVNSGARCSELDGIELRSFPYPVR